jgi:hypothetical protein
MPLPIVSWTDFRFPNWSLIAGTPLLGYDVDKLSDRDPSNPLWIQETTIGLQGALPAAQRVDVVTIHHHSFKAGTKVRLEMSNSPVWTSPPVRIDVIVPPWTADGFAPHLVFDVAAAYPSIATRTLSYLHVTNVTANTNAILIGEIAVGGVLQNLMSGMLIPLHVSTEWGVTYAQGKKGPRYVHDRRTRARAWSAQLSLQPGYWDAFRNVLAASKAMLYPMLVWPTNLRSDEPVLGRWSAPSLEENYPESNLLVTTDATFEELACGEAY